MANTDFARGFRPIRQNAGGPPKLTKYPAGTSTDIFRGDIVQLKNNGRVKTITTTAPGPDTTLGVAANFVDASASSSAQNVWVYDDPNQLFECQDDGAGATVAQTNVGNTAPVVVETGNTTTEQSKQELDISGAGTTTTDPLLIVDIQEGPKFEVGANASLIVRLNRHIYGIKSAGI